ncbi:MAG: threonine--tRNA ligase [Gammaproteobacteria bacterium]|nr:MAG: threonine--tRNA ligase [Gammaproteobacteria bacterium]
MPVITLPDGSQRSFDHPVSIYQIAEDIGPGLAKAALAGKVGDQLVDVSFILSDDADVSIITPKNEEGLEIIRHSTAHLLAMAVKELYPTAQVTIGPVVGDGFFYDFAYERAFTPEDMKSIEERMGALAKQDFQVSRMEMSRDEAVEFFRARGEDYKVEIIEDIPAGETLSLYQQGDFVDLCRGPHVPNTKRLQAFTLTKVAGAYWRGDAENAMLQRVYGTAWADKKALKMYLKRQKEAGARDHRKIGKALDFFHTQEEAPGMVFWHPKGWKVYQVLEQYIRDLQDRSGYQEIRTPQIVDRILWEKSGHWEKFREDMFCTQSENRDYAVKPMNCPCHVQVFNQGLKSYRDLPLRLAEFGSCHRNEPSGTLHGLMRVRNFTQDDGHIFCTEGQVQEEVSQFIDLLFSVYRDFGFDDVLVKLSTRPANRVGSDEVWDRSEKALELALNNKGLEWDLLPGEGAFYGPKIEFTLKDCLGRLWQCGTIQVDFSMTARLDAQYVAEDGSRQVPVMLHRAILGSFERFIGILIENYAGILPPWLAPVQAVIMNITSSQSEYCEKMQESMRDSGFRVNTDLRNEKISFKIREHTLQKVPYLLVVGDREVENQTVAVRSLGGKDLGVMSIDDFIEMLGGEVAKLGRIVSED